MYQIALKYGNHYQILNSSIIYCDKQTAMNALENVSNNAVMGDGEYVLLEYSPFKVYRLENGKLVNISTRKEKV